MLFYRNWVIMDLASLNFGYELSTTTILCICEQQGSGEFAYMHGSPESSLFAISSDFGKQIKTCI